ncbi:MAG TPA: symmetrical bis(5'-nucleosyl)-tetraphosphatase [Gammaproteobacteria bacterium]|nr:symmetrical bis(5'-nucleosyl)-tetraphosphatase [Gammaproteobacteria bacterium]
MATWAIGDIQGCYDELQALLAHIDFDDKRDQLWLSGDLVNRGPQSLETLRFVKKLGNRAVTVLGNHDLHLLAVACGVQAVKPRDTFTDILNAPDRDDLLYWLRYRPLLHADNGFTLIHAGLPPQWTIHVAQSEAREVEAVLQNPGWQDFLGAMYGNEPDCWSPGLNGVDRWRFTINCLTRLRYCTVDGRLEFAHKDAPGSQHAELLPWFMAPNRKSAGKRLLFGHWSTLGAVEEHHQVFPLDTGCVWGGKLTALRLDGPLEYRNVSCEASQRPRL